MKIYNLRSDTNTSWHIEKDGKISVHRIKNYNHLSHSNSHRMSKWRIITGSSDVNEISYLASVKPKWFSSTPLWASTLGHGFLTYNNSKTPKTVSFISLSFGFIYKLIGWNQNIDRWSLRKIFQFSMWWEVKAPNFPAKL